MFRLLVTLLCLVAAAGQTLAAESIVCIGDSITRGAYLEPDEAYPAVLETMLPGTKVINAGVPGNTSGQGLDRLDADVLAHRPDCVVVFFGTNDSVLRAAGQYRVPVDRFADNLRQIIDRCSKQNARVVLCTLPAINSEPYFQRHPKEYYQSEGALEAIVGRYRDATLEVGRATNVPVVDLLEVFQKNMDLLRPAPDGVHPSAEGCRQIATLVAMQLKGEKPRQAVAPKAPPMVNESARQIPVAYSVDVVVVGGGTGAVSAAVAAAERGAKVFLAARRPYLRDDMTATLRLWREKDDRLTTPLAERIYTDTNSANLSDPNRIEFTYEADQPSAGVHKDSKPPGLLTDYEWGDPTRQSVQYDGDVNITADLGKTEKIARVAAMIYDRGGNGGFRVRDVTVSTSNDKKSWSEQKVIANKKGGPGDLSIVLAAPLATECRYVKFFFKKAENVKRILLGEIEIIAPAPKNDTTHKAAAPLPRPMHVKKVLDEALLEAGVQFLYGCYATDVLRDGQGRPCGIVMANRAGRQAVVAKTIIDATDRAVIARLAGASFRPFPAGPKTFTRVVIGGEIRQAPGMTAREISPPFRGPFPNAAGTSGGTFRVIEYTLELPLAEDSPTAWCAADQRARSLTYHPEQQFTSDQLFTISPDWMHGRATAAEDAKELPLDAFRPRGVERLLVLGGCADISRARAERLMRPAALIELGARVGKAAAAEAAKLPAPKDVKLPGKPTTNPAAEGDVGEFLVGVRPTQKLPTIPQDARALPVVGRYDVVVIGGGTAGAPAGIGSASQGAKTLVVEFLHGLGGVGTTGAISKYCSGNRVGFTAEVEGGASWVIEQRMQWWRNELLKAGADIWFGSIGCGAFVDDGRVRGAVVATQQGRGVVLANVVIDATGAADVAAAAGAPCRNTSGSEFAMQGTGLPPRQLGATYTNTDYTFTDETDMVDVWHLLVDGKQRYAAAFDLGQLVDTRERRSVVGEFTVSFLDQIAKRTFPDTIMRAVSSYDTHGYIIEPYLLLKHPLRSRIWCDLPYRSMLPKGLSGILVAGIASSAHRDAQPVFRMQPDIQNQGYAAGVAAAMVSKAGVDVREVDIRALQKHLVEIGNLPESVLTDEDSFPLPAEKIAAAVESVKDESQGLAIILSHPRESLPLLKRAHQAATGQDKVAYAKILGMMDDPTGADTLIAEVKAIDKWEAPPSWRINREYEDWRRVGWSMSHLDNTIMSLGLTKDPPAVPVIAEKMKLLTTSSPFPHYRSTALALELIADPSAAKPLAEMLALEGITGYSYSSREEAEDLGRVGRSRYTALRELALARALYRCGDPDGLGKRILTTYTHDLRGHFARHASAVLAAGEKD